MINMLGPGIALILALLMALGAAMSGSSGPAKNNSPEYLMPQVKSTTVDPEGSTNVPLRPGDTNYAPPSWQTDFDSPAPAGEFLRNLQELHHLTTLQDTVSYAADGRLKVTHAVSKETAGTWNDRVVVYPHEVSYKGHTLQEVAPNIFRENSTVYVVFPGYFVNFEMPEGLDWMTAVHLKELYQPLSSLPKEEATSAVRALMSAYLAKMRINDHENGEYLRQVAQYTSDLAAKQDNPSVPVNLFAHMPALEQHVKVYQHAKLTEGITPAQLFASWIPTLKIDSTRPLQYGTACSKTESGVYCTLVTIDDATYKEVGSRLPQVP